MWILTPIGIVQLSNNIKCIEWLKIKIHIMIVICVLKNKHMFHIVFCLFAGYTYVNTCHNSALEPK